MAKHLARLGWDVTVVTPRPSVFRHIDDAEVTEGRLAREGIRRIVTDHRWRCLEPDHLRYRDRGPGWLVGGLCRNVARRFGLDSAIGWLKAAENACARLTERDVDVVLASGPPFGVFGLARRVASRLGRPYVLDYRDPWTGSPHAAESARPATVRHERSLLAGAAAVTIVSDSWARALNRRFGIESKLHVVTNGYDPEDVTGVERHAFDHFAIVYAGTFYPPKRIITPVLEALKILDGGRDAEARSWGFHYYGPQQHHVAEEATRLGVLNRVVLHGTVPRSEALSAVAGAGIAVVITAVTANASLDDDGIVTGKLFEALAVETPVLLIAPAGSDARMVVEHSGIGRGFVGSETLGMAAFIADTMRRGPVAPKHTSTYAWPTIAAKLDEVLRQARSTTR